MIDIKDYENLEKYIECGISKIIGKRFANKDNIDKIVSKVIKYSSKFDESKKMSYKSYIHMIVKTSCYSIFKNSVKVKLDKKKLALYKEHRINNSEKDNTKMMLVVEEIMNDNVLSELEKEVIRKKYLESKTVKSICSELNLEKNEVNKIANKAILKMQSNYSSIDKLQEKAEMKYGKTFD